VQGGSGSGAALATPSATPSPGATEAGTNDTETRLVAALAQQAGIKRTDVNIESVGPTWGAEISKKAVRGLVIVLIAIGLYIAFRFEWAMAAGAMIALVHDVTITAGVYALTGRVVTPETVIAILTILGFSLYDTVVIYDKVKENTESAALLARMGYTKVVDLSLNQTVMRSVNTSLVVLLPILSLLLFGGETLKDFAFAMFVGVAIGAYSSIFIAAPMLTIIKSREMARRGPARATGRPGAAARTRAAAVPAVDGAGVAVCAPASGTPFAAGDTRVTCDATDATGNSATPISFTVHVIDTTAATPTGSTTSKPRLSSAKGATTKRTQPRSAPRTKRVDCGADVA
jgi:preprotein translocase subunit SecF